MADFALTSKFHKLLNPKFGLYHLVLSKPRPVQTGLQIFRTRPQPPTSCSRNVVYETTFFKLFLASSCKFGNILNTKPETVYEVRRRKNHRYFDAPLAVCNRNT